MDVPARIPGADRSFARLGSLPDVLVLAAILTGWWLAVGPIVIEERLQGTDVFRDAATAIRAQHGRFFSDPSYADQTLWYPPLSPWILAALSAWLGLEPLDGYRWSQLLLNWMIPAGLYLLLVPAWSRLVAAGAVVALLLAMPWWQSEVAHGQPSIHAVILGLVTLSAYCRQQHRASYAWAVVCGVLQGVSFWHHPFVPAVLTVAFVLQGWWSASTSGDAGHRSAVFRLHRANLLITLLLAAPILVLMTRGPVLNAEPREYLAAELGTAEFALLHGSPVLWGLGLLGLWRASRRLKLAERLLLCCLGVTLLAQVPGYVRLYGGAWARLVPVLVPHEFQRLFQIAWAVFIGLGVSAVVDRAMLRVAHPRRRLLGRSILFLAACALIAGPWWTQAPQRLRRYLRPLKLSPDLLAAADWVRNSTDVDDTFIGDHDLAFTWLGATTGRKAWLVPPGHSNPRIDWVARKLTLDALREATDPSEVWSALRANAIRFLVFAEPWTPVVFSRAGWERFFHPAFAAGSLTIYEVRPAPTDAS